MNPSIVQLYKRLKSTNDSVQQHAVTEIVMLLERGMHRPEADEGLCTALLPEDLLALNLSPAEMEAIISFAIEALNSNDLLRSTKISLFWAITKLADLKYGDELMQFFSDHVGTFDEQEAFSSLAVLTRYFGRFKHGDTQLKDLLARHNFLKLLEAAQGDRSPRLQQSVTYLIKSVRDE